jgi:hypothetical protein
MNSNDLFLESFLELGLNVFDAEGMLALIFFFFPR